MTDDRERLKGHLVLITNSAHSKRGFGTEEFVDRLLEAVPATG